MLNDDEAKGEALNQSFSNSFDIQDNFINNIIV